MKRLLILALLVFSTGLSHSLEVDLTDMNEGEIRVVTWKDQPVYVYRRSEKQIEYLKKHSQAPSEESLQKALFVTAKMYGNELASLFLDAIKAEFTPTRSYDEKYTVVMALTTYRGCLVELLSNRNRFFDSCNYEHYDVAGRLLTRKAKNGYHLLIPPHYFDEDKIIFREKTNIIDFAPDILNLPVSEGDKMLEALQWQKEELASIILERSPQVIAHETAVGAIPLHIAVMKNSIEMVNALLEAGSDINYLTQAGLAPIHFAMMVQSDDKVEYLIMNGAKFENYCVKDVCMPSLARHLAQNRPSASDEDIDKYIAQIRSLRNKYITNQAKRTQ